MPTIRASVSSVIASLRAELQSEAATAAGSNDVISRAEEQSLGDSVTREAAAAVRASGGPGARVTVDALVDEAETRLRRFIDDVNQTSGAGADTVSQDEIRAIAALHPEAGQRVARAYELITGRAISLAGVTAPSPATGDDTVISDFGTLLSHAHELVEGQLREYAGGNERISASERAQIEPEFLRTAASAAPPPRLVIAVATHIMLEVVRPALADAGIDLGQFDAYAELASKPMTIDAMRRLVAANAGVAGLLADAAVASGAPRPDLAGLPVRRFGVTTTVVAPPTSTGPSASLQDVIPAVRDIIASEAQTAARTNSAISRAEQQTLDPFLQGVAEGVRSAGGAGFTLTVAALVDATMTRIDAVTAARLTGPDANTLTEEKLWTLAETEPAVALRLARGFAQVTGRPVLGINVPAPLPADNLGDLNLFHHEVLAYVRRELTAVAGSNLNLSADERRALPEGLVRDAAEQTPPPRTVDAVLTWMHDHVVLPALAAANIDAPNLGTFDRVLPLTRDDFFPLVALHPELAGLFADAVLWHTGSRPDVPDLPSVVFRNPSAIADAPSVAGTVANIPGAPGPVHFPDAARVDDVLDKLSALVDLMDWSRNGTISKGEADSFINEVSRVSVNHPDREAWPQVARVLYELREQLWAQTRSNPTGAAIKDALQAVGNRVHQLGWDEVTSTSAWDVHGHIDILDEYHPFVILETIRHGGLDIYQEPWVRLLEHEGDRAPNLRRPLTVTGDPDTVIRNIVFHFNRSDNDNRWPRWSGVHTSRYVLDAAETDSVVTTIRNQQPAARRLELFEAMVRWLDQPLNQPGRLYLDEPARAALDALAAELGHPRRFPLGAEPAPAMPRP